MARLLVVLGHHECRSAQLVAHGAQLEGNGGRGVLGSVRTQMFHTYGQLAYGQRMDNVCAAYVQRTGSGHVWAAYGQRRRMGSV